MSDVLNALIEWYRHINAALTWRDTVQYATIATVTYTVYCFAIKPFRSPLRKIPGPGYNPLFGNVREAMVGEAMASSVKWVKQYGGIVRFYHLFGRERVLVADPEALKHIFVTHVHKYHRIPNISRILGSGIFNVSGEKHTFQRRLMNPFFNHDSIQGYLDIFQENCEKLIKNWNVQMGSVDSTCICVQNSLMCMTLDTIGKAVFSYDFEALDVVCNPAFSAFRAITDRPSISFRQSIPFLDRLTGDNDFNKSLTIIDNIIFDIINSKRLKLLEAEGSSEYADATKDLLGKLMLACDSETGQRFSDGELRDQVFSLLLAGHETTGASMSWMLLLLASHTDVQDKVRAEVMQVLPALGEPITWHHLDQLTYLNAVIKESQRLYPAAPSFYRRVVEEDVLCGYTLPKGTLIAYHVGAMMRNPNIWKDPERFDPERFLGDNVHDIELYTHLPFIAGPHKCLGHQFAKMQMRLVIANLLRQFSFTTQEGLCFKRKSRVTLKAYPPVTLNVAKTV